MWLTQRGEEKGKLWGKCYSPPSCPLISQEEKHIKFAVLISIVFKKSNLCNEYLSGRSPAGCWQPGFLDTVWNGGCTFHSLAPSPFFAIYLMSGQRCVCSRSEGRWIPAVLTMLSPAPRGSEPVAGAQQGPCQPGTPPKLRKVPLLPPGAAWLPGVCHPWAPLLETLAGQLPRRGTDGNTRMNQTGVSMDDSGLAVAAAESLVPARAAPAGRGERGFLGQC